MLERPLSHYWTSPLSFLFSIFDAGSFLIAFLTLKHKKINQVCFYCYVFYCFYEFLMYFIVFNFYVFYCFMIFAVSDLDLDQY